MLLLFFFLIYQCQAEEPKRGVLEPRDPMAAAVHQEHHEQVSHGRTGRLLEHLRV